MNLITLFTTLLLAQDYDVILRNGMAIDGTGAKAVRADVGIVGGHIRKVGNLKSAKAKLDLDVRGLTVAPGFINLHSHATPDGVASAVNMLTQGVTTEIINADGYGTKSNDEQLRMFAAKGLAVNLGANTGFNYAWGAVMGNADRRPTAAEIEQMRQIIEDNLKQGAWGVSAGLDYKPGYFAKTSEVISIVDVARRWRTNFPNHDRLTPESKYSSLAGIAETIEIGSKAGLMSVITHMKVQGREQGSAAKAIAMMTSGPNVVADIYPYLAGQTGVGALFVPGWAVAGGRDAMLKRFADPELRPRIAKEIEEAIVARMLTPANIAIPSRRKMFTDYMREMNAGAGETMIRIYEQEERPPAAIMTFGKEEDLIALLQYPGAAVSCDCGASLEFPGMHPRYFGTFPRVLGHYARDVKAMALEEAVRKMTGLPASIAGMTDRGFLAAGMAADIVVFDVAAVRDRATYEAPTLASEGVRHVLVNGMLALRDGKSTGAQGGVVLRRGEHMPSRAMRIERGGVLKGGARKIVENGLVQTGPDGWRSMTAWTTEGPTVITVDGGKTVVSR